MKKIFVLLLSVSLVFVSSCNIDTGDDVPPAVVTEGVYILNNGNYASNDASLALYNPDSKAISTNVFENANGKKLGDLAQDMLFPISEDSASNIEDTHCEQPVSEIIEVETSDKSIQTIVNQRKVSKVIILFDDGSYQEM